MKKLELALEKMEISLEGVSAVTADELVTQAYELIKEYIEENKPKKQPKKTPYTAETFPENAIWMKNIESGDVYSIQTKSKSGMVLAVFSSSPPICAEFEDVYKYKIGCQVIKDGEIKIEWRPFYVED